MKLVIAEKPSVGAAIAAASLRFEKPSRIALASMLLIQRREKGFLQFACS